MAALAQAISGTAYRGSRESWNGSQAGSVGTPVSRGVLGSAFTIALLLTGTVKQAEAAVIEAIRRIDPEQASEEAFLQDCANAAMVRTQRSFPNSDAAAEAAAFLPHELQRILLLTRDLRRSFVLRVLLRMPADACARFGVPNASHFAAAAAQQMAHYPEVEPALPA